MKFKISRSPVINAEADPTRIKEVYRDICMRNVKKPYRDIFAIFVERDLVKRQMALDTLVLCTVIIVVMGFNRDILLVKVSSENYPYSFFI